MSPVVWQKLVHIFLFCFGAATGLCDPVLVFLQAERQKLWDKLGSTPGTKNIVQWYLDPCRLPGRPLEDRTLNTQQDPVSLLLGFPSACFTRFATMASCNPALLTGMTFSLNAYCATDTGMLT